MCGIQPGHEGRIIRAGRCLLGLEVVAFARLACVRVDSVRRAEGGGATVMRRRLTELLLKLGIQFKPGGVVRRPGFGKNSPLALFGRTSKLIHRLQPALRSSEARAIHQALAAANNLSVAPQERSSGSVADAPASGIRVEDLTEPDQDVAFDEMIRQYTNPSADVRGRYAAIGWATQRALKRSRTRQPVQRPRRV